MGSERSWSGGGRNQPARGALQSRERPGSLDPRHADTHSTEGAAAVIFPGSPRFFPPFSFFHKILILAIDGHPDHFNPQYLAGPAGQQNVRWDRHSLYRDHKLDIRQLWVGDPADRHPERWHPRHRGERDYLCLKQCHHCDQNRCQRDISDQYPRFHLDRGWRRELPGVQFHQL